MIHTKEINIKWNSYTKKYYINLGYKFTKLNDIFKIKIEHLQLNSHYIVDVECDNCHKKIKKDYKSYNNCLINKNFYVCSDCRFHKTKMTNNEKYGVDNVSFLNNIKETIRIKSINNSDIRTVKREQTNIIKYGCKNPFQNQQIINDNVIKSRITKIKNGRIISDEYFNEFELYKRYVNKLTYKNKKILIENWDGLDYYDGEYIKDNFKYDSRSSNYPTIDHKISIRYGYDNNIPVEQISSIDNLCITKKKINTSKYTKTEDEYKSKNKT